MKLKEIMRQKELSAYRLAKMSNVPYSTISDLLKSDADILECSVLTVSKIASALNVTIESLIKQEEIDFELFKSEVCQKLKRLTDLNFIEDILNSKIIFKYYKRELYKEAFYLLAMLDYLCRINNLPICIDYEPIRKHKLSKIVYPRSLLIDSKIKQKSDILEKAKADAIPEFLRFNILENEIRNVA